MKNVQRLKNCMFFNKDVQNLKREEQFYNGKRKGTTEMKRKQSEAFSWSQREEKLKILKNMEKLIKI